MWYDILKVQVLGSKQKVKMGIKPLPKEEETNCKERLLKFFADIKSKKTSITVTDSIDMDRFNRFDKDEKYCMIIDALHQISKRLLEPTKPYRNNFDGTTVSTDRLEEKENWKITNNFMMIKGRLLHVSNPLANTYLEIKILIRPDGIHGGFNDVYAAWFKTDPDRIKELGELMGSV
jgi:hypothetical protein